MKYSKEERISIAGALLATSRQRMTGREIGICERLVAGDFVSNKTKEIHGKLSKTGWDMNVFISLHTQFYAEIVNYENNTEVAAS